VRNVEEEHLRLNDKVQAKVVAINEDGKIDLSIKALQDPAPRIDRAARTQSSSRSLSGSCGSSRSGRSTTSGPSRTSGSRLPKARSRLSRPGDSKGIAAQRDVA
jgi:hypothetical protein